MDTHTYVFRCDGQTLQFPATKEGLTSLATAMDAAEAAGHTYRICRGDEFPEFFAANVPVERRKVEIDPMPRSLKVTLIAIVVVALAYVGAVLYTIGN